MLLEVYTAYKAGLVDMEGDEIPWGVFLKGTTKITIEFIDIPSLKYIKRTYQLNSNKFFLLYEDEVKNNVRHGRHRTFYLNGRVAKILYLSNNKLHGICKWFDLCGKKIYQRVYDQARIMSHVEWSAGTGKLRAIRFRKKDGLMWAADPHLEKSKERQPCAEKLLKEYIKK